MEVGTGKNFAGHSEIWHPAAPWLPGDPSAAQRFYKKGGGGGGGGGGTCTFFISHHPHSLAPVS